MFSARTGAPFTIFDSTNYINGTNVPRYMPASAVTSFSTGSPINLGQNTFTFLTLPAGVSFADPVLGISDFGSNAFLGTWPANMTRRNAFRGPGAWNLDIALSKSFSLTERVKLQLRAESFDFLNHHNYYVNGLNLDVANFAGPVLVQGSKGGLGVNAIGGNHDERRYGQFALRISF